MDKRREQRAKFTVLVVEDDAMVRQVSVGLLKMLGYRTLEATDGKSALALLETAAPPHVLFTDVMMPGGMSGFQLAEAVREKQPALRIVFVSGYDETNLSPPLDGVAAARVLRKPFKLSELEAALDEALRAD